MTEAMGRCWQAFRHMYSSSFSHLAFTTGYRRRLDNFVNLYVPLADAWVLWDNTLKPPGLLLESPALVWTSSRPA